MAEKLFDPRKVIQKYVEGLKKAGIHPEQILLYGSYATGKAHQWSDIDLVVISRDFEKIPPLERLELLSLATWDVDAPIEAQGYTPREIADRGKDSIIWSEIEKNHKVVYKAD